MISFFVYYYIQKYGTDFIDSTKEPIFIRIKSIGFKYVNNVNICNQKKMKQILDIIMEYICII